MREHLQSDAVQACAHSNARHRARHSQESGFAFLMALGLIFIALALSLVILENFVTDGKRTREEETIWRGEQYERAVRLYYHKMGRYPQTIDDLKKGGLNLHFLRQEYKNPMNKTDGTWRFIYVNAAGQIIGSTRYNNLQQMVLIDQYAGLIPGAATPGAITPGQQVGVSAASLASTSGIAGFGGVAGAGGIGGAGVSAQQQQQLQTVLAGILNPGDTTPDQANNGTQLPPLDSSQNGASPTGNSSSPPPDTTAPSDTSQPGAAPQLPADLAAQLPPGVTQDQVNQFLQNGQLPAGITPDQVAQYVQGIQLPPGVTQDQITQYIQNLQSSQQGGGSSPSPQNLLQQNGQTGLGLAPGQNGQSALGLSAGQLGLGSSSQSAPALNPLLALKPTGPVDSPVLGAFFTGVACTTDVKGVKYYRRAKKYKDWEFIWNPLEDALAAAQQPGGGQQQGGVLPGQSSAASGLGGSSSLSNTFGSSSISIGSGSSGSGSIGSSPQQPQQQPQ
ncbi:MAG: hypothetical protein WCD49_17460 [Candidatus Acidiferrales bacterium]